MLTTPLFYANASPHMGSAYPTMAADALARYHRLTGKTVRFVTGTDEHGEKIALSAEARGLTPTDHVDSISAEFRALWSDLDIAFDAFVRTTDDKHARLVRSVIDKVRAKGDIYMARYSGHYCIDCEEYKAESDMTEDGLCPIHLKPCVLKDEENYFFRLSKYQERIERLFEENPDFVQPESRRNEVLGWVKKGLNDFSISRGAVDWGIKFPEDPSQTVYVWFDALLGYVSAIQSAEEADVDGGAAAPEGWPADVHIIGKDILRFHAVYWPAMLMSAELALPRAVYGHGFLTKDGLKMGKSLGNVLDPKELVGSYGSDAVRYFFLKEIPFGQDGDFKEDSFVDIVNAHLANNIGNCLNRTSNLLKKNCASTLPLDAESIAQENPIRRVVEESVPLVGPAFEALDFGAACEAVLSISNRCNQHMEEVAPWSLFKSESSTDREKAEQVLVSILEALRVVAIVLSPVTPELSQKIYAQLGCEGFDAVRWEDAHWGVLKEGHVVNKPKPVFQRLEIKATESVAT